MKGAHTEVFGVLASDIYTNVCLLVCFYIQYMKKCVKEILELLFKKYVILRGDDFCNGLYTTHECQVKLASTISTKILLLW